MGGYDFFRRRVAYCGVIPRRGFCVLAFPLDTFRWCLGPGHGYRLVHPSHIGLWVVEQRFAAQFGVRQGRKGGISSWAGVGSGRVLLKETRK